MSSILAAIRKVEGNGLSLSPQMKKAYIKSVYLNWRLENANPKDLTIIAHDTTTGELTLQDDVFEDTFKVELNDLYEVIDEPYTLKHVPSFEGSECFGTLVESLTKTHHYELAMVCFFAIHKKWLSEKFEESYPKLIALTAAV